MQEERENYIQNQRKDEINFKAKIQMNSIMKYHQFNMK